MIPHLWKTTRVLEALREFVGVKYPFHYNREPVDRKYQITQRGKFRNSDNNI